MEAKKTDVVSEVKPLDLLVNKFYKSLSPAERTTHEIAARSGSDGGLGSSYIVKKTPAYIKWLQKELNG